LTGYPPELLDLELDLEADLGVDTVKQAEVFAAVRSRFGVERDESLKLRDFPTLNHVIGWISSKIEQPEPVAEPVVASAPQVDAQATDERFPRRVPIPVLRPAIDVCVESGVVLNADARVVVMADEGGVADQLVSRLEQLQVTPLVLSAGVETAALTATLDQWLADGPVHGVYWLAALDDEGPVDEFDLGGWREALRRRVKNLYTTMRACYASAPFLVSATRMGGQHGYDEAGATAPLGGAVSGFTKAYHREQPDALVKAVDVPLGYAADRIADALVAETQRDAGCVEVGLVDDGTRWTLALTEQPVSNGHTGMRLGADTVFAITGAAGSIVSAIVADLAAVSGGTFHLLDLTPEPERSDTDVRRFSTDRDGLMTDIAARLKERGERPTPVLVGKELARIERSAAALAAIEAIEAAGGVAHYYQVDLTDPDVVSSAVADIARTSGHVDVLLHAAGLEISRSLPDKQPGEYDLVFDVKTEGWFNLLHAARELPLGAVVAFSSVAGRFGNAGQTDYSAANDLLCKLVSNMRRTRPTVRALAIDWTAWGGIGMATRGSIPKIMEMAGVQMLDPQIGVPWIRHELTDGGRHGEVVVAGGLGMLAAAPRTAGGLEPSVLVDAGPMIGSVELVEDGLVVRTTLDPVQQPFLNDHRIDGVAVLPGVMGLEAFAEVARLLAPKWHVTALEDVDFLAPLKFYRDEPRELTIRARAVRDHTDIAVRCTLEAQRLLPGSSEPQRTVHFTGEVILSRTPMEPEHAAPITEPKSTVGSDRVYELYFHGPAYQVVGATWRDHAASVAQFASELPPNSASGGPTAILPRLVELCFQGAGLLEAAETGRLALPQRVDCLRIVADPPPGALYATATQSGDGFDCIVQDAAGQVVLALDGYRTVATPATVPDELRQALASSGKPELSPA
jgi:NAD(P)-dependent dehydrogenase (short-subunit alcohol dehydrogenase family)